jgi:hypothetical protein
MLDLNRESSIFYPLHGTHMFTWSVNASSFLSHLNGDMPVSSLRVRCMLNKEKAHSNIMKIFNVDHQSASDDIIIENDSEIAQFRKGMKNGIKNSDSFIASDMCDLYMSKDSKVLVLSLSYSHGIPGQKQVEIISTIEVCFTDIKQKNSIEKKIQKLLNTCYEKSEDEFDESSPIIGMVCSDKDGLTIRRYSLDEHVKPMTDEELDLHYGDGFSDFNQKVIDTLKSDSKGLLIFHGTPGSGKTHYIRMLIKELAESTKNVIYIPSSFVEMFMEPSFLTFLQDWIVTMNNPTIILIEDSESLIESRDPGYRSQGISNLLNATDGILNDILGTQIILTFNIDIEMIDDALLRPERLLARKEFLDLDSEQAKKLLLHLGIDNYEPQGFMSLASIYSMKNSRNIIEHNARRKKERIGF